MRASGSTVPLSVLKFRMTNSCWTGSASGAAACACANCSPKITTINALHRTALSQYFRSLDYDPEDSTIIVASDSGFGPYFCGASPKAQISQAGLGVVYPPEGYRPRPRVDTQTRPGGNDQLGKDRRLGCYYRRRRVG